MLPYHCPECAKVTSGRCALHASVTYVIGGALLSPDTVDWKAHAKSLEAEVAQLRQDRDALYARELNAFVAGWNAAKADAAAADDEDVADAPDVAWADYQSYGDAGKRSVVRECGCSIYEPCSDHPEPGAASKETSAMELPDSGLRGDPVVRDGQIDGTRDQMCKRISELEAARDHLRARLQQQIVEWQAKSQAYTVSNDRAGAWRFEALDEAFEACAADLLAVLTEPPQEQNDEKTNEHATRSAETDVTREVALPQPPTESHS